ncbi:hypothetical protein [Kribbella sandramycini]|uniref:Uncharacterized protein n=1 Tax=Kribbella sandramycini TaxID=60450 RepID=A0A841SDT0_9ACTN|nr:hypothetical protein [Kribbella sandramycini]MBB6570148.1 hypothetical protein [Kribbella sandramycini]
MFNLGRHDRRNGRRQQDACAGVIAAGAVADGLVQELTVTFG